MKVLSHFDGGVPRPFEISDDTITFNLANSGTLHVLLRDTPAEFGVRILVDERPGLALTHQGLFYSHDGRFYRATSTVERAADLSFTFRIPAGPDGTWLCTRIPYGRDNLDRLLADCVGASHLSVRTLEAPGRMVPVFQWGEESRSRRVHWFIAGEDAWETAGTWVADGMVRALLEDRSLRNALLADAALCLVPMAVPYCATQPGSSYTAIDGSSFYGAATWSDGKPPAEFASIRDEVLKPVHSRRLGLLLNIHSWQGAYTTSTMEFIRTAGDRALTGKRLEWATRTLETLMTDVPLGKTRISEKIWHPGLARDYMLSEHDTVAFRIEITTAGQSYDAFAQTGHAILRNTARIDDWSGVLPGSSSES